MPRRIRNFIYSLLSSIRPVEFALLLKWLFRIGRIPVKTSTGTTFLVDPISNFGQQLLCHGIYEPQMVHLFQLTLRPSDVCIDVGGNEGYFSILASSLCTEGKVYCIEPQSRMQKILQQNIRTNNVHSVNIYQMALSDREGQVDLFLLPSVISSCSTTYKRTKKFFIKEKVPSITLDSFFKNNNIGRVRLLKIDIEGSEYNVVKGGLGVLGRQDVDFIALEYHIEVLDKEKILYIHELLKAAGYILTGCKAQTIYHLRGLEKEIEGLGNLRVDVSP
jgi:FkbM family methyltransferase